MNHETLSNVVSSLERGSKIEAIKHLRQAKGVSLQQAKEEVEAYLEENSHLNFQFKEAASSTNDDTFLWTFFIVILAAALYYITPY